MGDVFTFIDPSSVGHVNEHHHIEAMKYNDTTQLKIISVAGVRCYETSQSE